MEQGWTMGDIDDMDIFYYLKVRRDQLDAKKATETGDESVSVTDHGRAFIDEVWPL